MSGCVDCADCADCVAPRTHNDVMADNAMAGGCEMPKLTFDLAICEFQGGWVKYLSVARNGVAEDWFSWFLAVSIPP